MPRPPLNGIVQIGQVQSVNVLPHHPRLVICRKQALQVHRTQLDLVTIGGSKAGRDLGRWGRVRHGSVRDLEDLVKHVP